MGIRDFKKTLKIILQSGILLVILFFTAGMFFVVSAPEVGAETIEYDNPLNTDSIIEVVDRVADYFYYVAIAIVPIITIYAAVLFFTAGGNDQQVGKAKKTFFWLIIGIAIILIGGGVITLLKDILNVN
jgi:sterol desaturase/sphingolipid hydroxylase (fatty acid hydroxylase superfamily)